MDSNQRYLSPYCPPRSEDSRTTKIGHSDFGPGDGGAFAMRCPRCRAFPHYRTPRLDPVTALVANAEFSPQPREVVGAHRILGTLLR